MRTLAQTIELVEATNGQKSSFTEADFKGLHRAMENLSERGFTAIVMRFWCLMSIEDIARTMGLSWSCADELVASSLAQLNRSLRGNDRKEAIRLIYTGKGGSIEHQNS